MERNDIVFEIKEIRKRFNPNMPNSREDYVYTRTGTATIKGDEIEVYVDDDSQPHGILKVNDSGFKKLIRKIFDATR